MHVKPRESHVKSALEAYIKSRRLHISEITHLRTLIYLVADVYHYAESVGMDTGGLIDHAKNLYLDERTTKSNGKR